jgi:hypothetical protein
MFGTSGQLFVTASSAIGGGGGGSTFPFSGSAVITGSLLVSGSGLTVTGSTNLNGTLRLGPGLGTISSPGDGTLTIAAQATNAYRIQITANEYVYVTTPLGIVMPSAQNFFGYGAFRFTTIGGSQNVTAGIFNQFVISDSFFPTTGTGVYNAINLSSTISQSSAATGVSRAILINPTLTSAKDFRAIEWTNNASTVGSGSWGLYGSGSAPNYLSGSLGIGTTSPSASLHISGSTGVLLEIDSNAAPNALYVSSSGNIGVGTNTPIYKLDVTTQARIAGVSGNVGTIGGANYALSLQNNSLATWLEILNNGGINKGAFFGITSNNFEQWNYQGGPIDFYTSTVASAGSLRLRIGNNGNVLIGSTSDSGERLQVSGSGKFTNGLVVTGALDIGIAEFNSTSSITTAGSIIVSSNATASYNSAFYNYSISSGSNARAGQIMSIWNGTTIRYTEVLTTDIGNTNSALFAVGISGANIQLQFTSSGVWTVKSIANLL